MRCRSQSVRFPKDQHGRKKSSIKVYQNDNIGHIFSNNGNSNTQLADGKTLKSDLAKCFYKVFRLMCAERGNGLHFYFKYYLEQK